jgi:hypothetical protein
MKTMILNRKELKVLDATIPSMFKELDPIEEIEFRDWARKHLFDEVHAIYHPVIQDAMLRAQEERASIRQKPS